MLTQKNAEEILRHPKKGQFIYFYRGNENEIGPVAEFADKVSQAMNCEAVILDCENKDDVATVVAILKNRNAQTAETIPKQMTENEFLIVNKFDDIWFWRKDLMQNIQGAIAEQIFSFL